RGKSADTVSKVHGAGLPRRRRPATTRFSRTVRLLKTRRPCGTSATPWAAIASGARPVTIWPWTRTAPGRGGRSPTGTLIVVDFPAPLRPSRPRRRPSPRRRETRCSTWLSPYSASISSRASASLTEVDLPRARVGDDVAAAALHHDLAEVQH